MLFIPILASVSLRQLPSASVGFRRQWATISTYIGGAPTILRYSVFGREKGARSSWADVYLEIELAARRIRTLSSVSLSQLRWAAISRFNANSDETGGLRGSSGAPYNYLTTRRVARGGDRGFTKKHYAVRAPSPSKKSTASQSKYRAEHSALYPIS